VQLKEEKMTSKKKIEEVWQKGAEIKDKNPDNWRKDSEGKIIRKGSFGTHGDYGWEIDHKKPIAKGGTDDPRNLQPLHWEPNREKSDKHPKK
jgi:5-methylcytosine-specific restriction endonuclease McrA